MNQRKISVIDLLMGAHMLAYVLFSGVMFLGSFSYSFYMGDGPGAILPMYLIWTAAFIVHGWSYLAGKIREIRFAQRHDSADFERKAYREGFNDAVRMLRDGGDIPGRLMLDDDGELMDEPTAAKRKYR